MTERVRSENCRTTARAVLIPAVLLVFSVVPVAQGIDLIPTQVVKAPAEGGDFDTHRKILVSPTINTPEPFRGFGGWCGWPNVCRLNNGDLFVTFCAGYFHASWPTPLDMHPVERDRWKSNEQYAWIFDWDCPTGGKMMWIRSRDNGKTWTRPKALPVVPGAYYVSEVVQLRDGTLLATTVIQKSMGYWSHMPTTPLECARTAANHVTGQNVFFRSDDNGETWREISRITGVGRVDAVYSLIEAPDGSVLAIYNAAPIPGGPGWPGGGEPRWLTIVARSQDEGQTWSTLSVAGDNDFDTTEATGGYLPDGSIAFVTRPASTWFQSFDDGRTWTEPRQMHPGNAAERGKKLWRRGSLQVTPDGLATLVYAGGPGGNGLVIYSRDNGKTWIKPAVNRGFQFDPLAYYPNACVLGDGSLFAVGSHEGLGKNEYGPAGAEVTAMRFRIKSPAEGEGIELLPIGGPPVR